MVDSVTARIGNLKLSPPFKVEEKEADTHYGTLIAIQRIDKGCTSAKLDFTLPFPTKELAILFGKEEGPEHQFNFVHSGESTHLDFTFKEALTRPYIIRVFAKEYYIE
jgi:hypothetical protein